MKKVLILIAAVLLTTAVHASDLHTFGDKNATFTAGIMCTPSFNITIPGGPSPWEVYIGAFFPDGQTHLIEADPQKIIKWELRGPRLNGNTPINYHVRCSPTSNYDDLVDAKVSIITKWKITAGTHNRTGFTMSGDFDWTDLQLKANGLGGDCDGYALFEIVAWELTAETDALPGRREFHTTLVVDVSI